MSEPKFKSGQPVLVILPGVVLPEVDSVIEVLGYAESGAGITLPVVGRGIWRCRSGWVYRTEKHPYAAEYCLRPITDPDTDHTTTNELERTA